MRYAISLSAVILLCAGCVSLTSFQAPQALPPGGSSVGGGLAAGFYAVEAFGYPWPEADFLYRYGLGRQVDVGAKVTLPFACVSADVKWQFLNGPLAAAFDVGGSYGRSPYIDDFSEKADVIGAWPELIVGTDRIHASARALMRYSISQYFDGPATSTTWAPQVFVGGSFGDRFRVEPELSLTFGMGNRQDPTVLVGIGVALKYGPGAESDDLPMFGQ